MCKNIEFQHALISNSSDIVIFGNLKLVTGYWILDTGYFVHRPRVAVALAEAQALAQVYWLLVGKA